MSTTTSEEQSRARLERAELELALLRRDAATRRAEHAKAIEALAATYDERLDRLYRSLQLNGGLVGEQLARTTRELLEARTTVTWLEAERADLDALVWRLRGALRQLRGLPASARLEEDAWLASQRERRVAAPSPDDVSPDDDDQPDPALVRVLVAEGRVDLEALKSEPTPRAG